MPSGRIGVLVDMGMGMLGAGRGLGVSRSLRPGIDALREPAPWPAIPDVCAGRLDPPAGRDALERAAPTGLSVEVLLADALRADVLLVDVLRPAGFLAEVFFAAFDILFAALLGAAFFRPADPRPLVFRAAFPAAFLLGAALFPAFFAALAITIPP